MSIEEVNIKPKRTISPELKERMRQGRERAAQARKKQPTTFKLVRRKDAPDLFPDKKRKLVIQNATPEPNAPHEFLGLTMTNCPISCTPTHCAIGGSLHFPQPDGSVVLEGVCCHPHKGGIKPIHQTKPVIVERFNRAVEFLEHLKIEQKNR